MSGPPSIPPPPAGHAGLCETCVHLQIVRNTRGSRFLLCRLSREDPAYPRYPRLPVLSCAGYRPDARPAAQDGR